MKVHFLKIPFFKGAILAFAVFLILSPRVGSAANHNTPDGQAIVDQFLEVLKVQVIADLNEKADTQLSLVQCFENYQCVEAEDIISKFQEYRIYVGRLQYRDLEMRMKQMNQGYVVHSGIRLHFTGRDEVGRKEWAIIQELKERDDQAISDKLAIFQEAGLSPDSSDYYQEKKRLVATSEAYYKATISEYLAAYPFFGSAIRRTLSRAQARKLAEDVGREIEKVIENIKELKGNDIFELFGFTDSLEIVADQLNEESSKILTSYIHAMNAETTLFGKITAIFTNWKTLAFATCHVSTYTLASVPHPVVQLVRLGVGLACSSLGITITLRYLGESTRDLIRQMSYGVTKAYDNRILNQYIKSYFTTFLMSLLYVVPSLPGLKSRASGMGANLSVISRAYRMNKLNISMNRKDLRFNRSEFTKDLKSLMRSYGQYYGEELAVNAVIALSGHYSGIVVQIEKMLITRNLSSTQGAVSVMPFASILGLQ